MNFGEFGTAMADARTFVVFFCTDPFLKGESERRVRVRFEWEAGEDYGRG